MKQKVLPIFAIVMFLLFPCICSDMKALQFYPICSILFVGGFYVSMPTWFYMGWATIPTLILFIASLVIFIGAFRNKICMSLTPYFLAYDFLLPFGTLIIMPNVVNGFAIGFKIYFIVYELVLLAGSVFIMIKGKMKKAN